MKINKTASTFNFDPYDNIASLQKSAKNARLHLKKTSKLHIEYKKNMIKEGLKGFISEYSYGPYFIDEADPMSKIAIEIDGCYWHGCESCHQPGDTRILLIDKKKETYLKNKGWLIIRIKEHEIKKEPTYRIESIRKNQISRRTLIKEKLKKSFQTGTLLVKAMIGENLNPEWTPISNVLRHYTPNKKMLQVVTEIGSIKVTEDHSLFKGHTPIKTSELKTGETITGVINNIFSPVIINNISEVEKEKYTYDLSVPQAENFCLSSGILAHNSYSISGVSLDIEKSSKYQSMKENYINEYDKVVEAAKRSIKIIKGLRQAKYGVGISSALGPLSRPGVQSRRNFVSSGGAGSFG